MKFDSYYDNNLLQPEVGAHPPIRDPVCNSLHSSVPGSCVRSWLMRLPLKGDLGMSSDALANLGLRKIIIIIGIKLHT